jgi:hypothetical protein
MKYEERRGIVSGSGGKKRQPCGSYARLDIFEKNVGPAGRFDPGIPIVSLTYGRF